MYLSHGIRADSCLEPVWMREQELSEIARDFRFLGELTHEFSAPPRSLPIQVPQIRDIRRSSTWLVHKEKFQRDPLHAFVPELNCPLGHVTYCSDGRLEFSKKVTEQYQERVILETVELGQTVEDSGVELAYKSWELRKNAGAERARNIERLHESLQHTWRLAGNASPAPTLEPVFVESWRPRVRIQFSESIMTMGDLDWENRQKLVCGQHVAKKMIANASLWIPYNHPILSDLEKLSERPGIASELNRYGNKDILRDHLQHRRWAWIIRRGRSGQVIIDIPRTEAFYDARVAFFEYGNDHLLRNFCQRRHFNQRRTDKLQATRSIRGWLEQLMMISQFAWRKLKQNPEVAATYSQWSDFLVTSSYNEDSQIFRAIKELQVARYFLLRLKFVEILKGLGETKPFDVPDFNDLSYDSHIEYLVKTLLASNKKGSADRGSKEKGKSWNLLSLSLRTKPVLTEWQKTGGRLRDVKSFSLRDEADCALHILVRRQELHLMKERQKRISQESTRGWIFNPYSNEGYPPRCQCRSEQCDYRKGYLERPSVTDLIWLYSAKPNVSRGLAGARSAAATMGWKYFEGASKPAAPGIKQFASPPPPVPDNANIASAEQTTLPTEQTIPEQTTPPPIQGTIQHPSNSSSNITVVEWDPSITAIPMTEAASAPTIVPELHPSAVQNSPRSHSNTTTFGQNPSPMSSPTTTSPSAPIVAPECTQIAVRGSSQSPWRTALVEQDPRPTASPMAEDPSAPSRIARCSSSLYLPVYYK